MHAPICRKSLLRSVRNVPKAELTVPTPVSSAPVHTNPLLQRLQPIAAPAIASTPTARALSPLYSFPAIGASLTETINVGQCAMDWTSFRVRYEARYLGAFDAGFIRTLATKTPHMAARLVCNLSQSNPSHVAKIMEVFGELQFRIASHATRSELRNITVMLVHPELGPHGSAWLFNVIQRLLGDWSCAVCGTENATSTNKCKTCGNCSHMWECDACGLYNRGSISTCTGCGGYAKKSQIQAFRWRCPDCSYINPTSRLACSRCREGMPLPATTTNCTTCGERNTRTCFPWCNTCGASDSTVVKLWRCPWCLTQNNSLQTECDSCGEERVGASSVDWYQWKCGDCSELNPYWGSSCRVCNAERLDESSEAAVVVTCTQCGTLSHNNKSVCELCANTASWVCTTGACMTLNGAGDDTCRGCGLTPLMMLNDDALEWKPHGATAVQTGILLRAAQSTCSKCGRNMPPLAATCAHCCATQTPSTRLGSWMLLKALHDHSQSTSIDLVSIAVIREVCKALCTVDPSLLPWTGADIESGEATEAPSCPVTPYGRRHFGIRTLRDIIVCLTNQAKSHPQWNHRLLVCALDLVDLSNRSTDFDEIGYDVLSRLARAIRPHEAAQIDHDSRMGYLVEMKLSRQALVNNACCILCLSPLPCNCEKESV